MSSLLRTVFGVQRAARAIRARNPHSLAVLRLYTTTMSIPKTMKAILVEKTGDYDVNQLKEVPTPAPSADKIIIKVEWGGVNYIDNYKRGGVYNLPLPLILGEESSGTIVALPTSEEVLNSEDYKLRDFRVGDRVACLASASYAEYVAGPWIKVWKLPSHVETKLGAVAPLQALTALTMVRESYEVKKGDWVLVHAAAGGVGLVLLQICKHLGANVIGIVSSFEKAALAKEYGAEHLIVTKDTKAMIDEVKTMTSGEGCHVIYDGVGKDTWEADFEMIRRKGTLATYGNASGVVPPFPPLKLGPKNIKVCRPTMGNYMATAEECAFYFKWLFDLTDQGVLKYQIHKEYPFTAEGVKQSQVDIQSRGTTGKLLIKIA